MGYLVSEQDFINDNIFKYEDRMNNQYARFLDRTPTYVTYYNISNINSTVDNGFENVEALLGDNSPIRYNKVDNLPIYGIDQIVLDLNEDEEGLTTEFDGDAVILPNTIHPIPGDFFVINHLKIKVQFMVTDIKFDTIKSNNFYKISYTVKSISEPTQLEKQVSDKFKCVVDNIGTEEKCLIREDEYYLLKDLIREYDRIAENFKLFFYSEKYNVFMVNEANINFYDPYLTLFLKNNKIFTSKDHYKTIYPDIIGQENLLRINYSNSIYRALELGNKLPHQMYNVHCPKDYTSSFAYYNVPVIHITFPGDIPYLPIEFIDMINTFNVQKATYITQLLAKFVHGKLDTIYTIDLESLKQVEIQSVDRPTMILHALLLFIIKKSYSKFIASKI